LCRGIFGIQRHRQTLSSCRMTSPGERRGARLHRQSLSRRAAGHCSVQRHRLGLFFVSWDVAGCIFIC
jgi:hypothetical protein